MPPFDFRDLSPHRWYIRCVLASQTSWRSCLKRMNWIHGDELSKIQLSVLWDFWRFRRQGGKVPRITLEGEYLNWWIGIPSLLLAIYFSRQRCNNGWIYWTIGIKIWRIIRLVKWDPELAVSTHEREFMVNEEKVNGAF